MHDMGTEFGGGEGGQGREQGLLRSGGHAGREHHSAVSNGYMTFGSLKWIPYMTCNLCGDVFPPFPISPRMMTFLCQRDPTSKATSIH